MNVDELRRRQHDVVSREQALAHGISDAGISWRLGRRAWRRIHPGVYLTHDGELTWWSRAWAAVLHGGEGAALGMLGAAHVHRLEDRPPPGLVLMIPTSRRVVAHPPALQVRRRRTLAPVGVRGIPVTSVEDTVLDLAGTREATRDDAVAVVARAVQRRLTTPADVVGALDLRARHRHRDVLRLALGDVAAGAESVLEVGFLRGVVRRHRLPRLRMQVPDQVRGRAVRRDFVEEDFKLIVEVDGVLGHAGAGMHRDRRRDRAAARGGWLSLRCGWVDVRYDACELALDIAMSLRARGWRGSASGCGPRCPLIDGARPTR